jgi:hypothetical protein
MAHNISMRTILTMLMIKILTGEILIVWQRTLILLFLSKPSKTTIIVRLSTHKKITILIEIFQQNKKIIEKENHKNFYIRRKIKYITGLRVIRLLDKLVISIGI